MSQTMFRSALSIVLALLVPAQLLAADSAPGMLYANGTAWVNGSSVPKSAAVFAGDLVQTRPDSTAHISSKGSSMMVLADSLVKYQGPAVEVEHGTVRVTTAQGMETRAGEISVKPAGNVWTEFQVTDVDGTVKIAANKGDVTIQDQQGNSTTLQEGQQTTRDDTSNPEQKKKRKRRGAGAATAAGGGILSSSAAVYTGIAIVGGITTWVLLQSDEPLSPACPNNPCN